MKRIAVYLLLICCLLRVNAQGQALSANRGHSHNDYHQNIPFLLAYYAGMGSIEADVFLYEGKLYVAHEKKEIAEGRTLENMYLKPLAERFKQFNNKPYVDTAQHLQLVIDIKEDHEHVIPELVEELKPYLQVFNDPANANAVKIVLSGDMPAPAQYSNYPDYIYYDGRPNIAYTTEQLKHIAMISDELSGYTKWNGKGTPAPADSALLRGLINAAHAMHKPFRFWATQDSPNTWIQLEKLGVDWINTDHPQQLHDFMANRAKLEYTNPTPYPVYQPTYKSDGSSKKVKNIILLIGDGMGLAQIQAGLTANHGQLNMYQCRSMGFSQTKSANSDITDSAAGATAMACGEKTDNRYIGVDPQEKPLTNLPDKLAPLKIKTGIISSQDITDATPAAFYAHAVDRDSSQQIAADFVNGHVDVLIGSNQRSFLNNKDHALMDKIKAKDYQLFTSLADAGKVNQGKQIILLKDADTRPVKAGRGDMLKQSLTHTISILRQNKPGFFIMAEGAQIDYGGHANDLPYIVTELHDFDRTVAEALKFADEDGETLVIITADHETGGLSLLDASTAKGMVLGAFSTNDHTCINVPVFAYGPHSTDFMGTYQNNQIFHKILALLSAK